METFSTLFFSAENPSEEQHMRTVAEAEEYCNGGELLSY